MRLVSCSIDGRMTYGVVRDDRLVDLGGLMAGIGDLSDLLAQQRLDEARALAGGLDVTVPLDDITYQRTIPRPGKIFCIGVNYGGRNAEYRDGSGLTRTSRACSFGSRARSSATSTTSSARRRAINSTTRARSSR